MTPPVRIVRTLKPTAVHVPATLWMEEDGGVMVQWELAGLGDLRPDLGF